MSEVIAIINNKYKVKSFKSYFENYKAKQHIIAVARALILTIHHMTINDNVT